MLTGYARVSKADGRQLLDIQRDALTSAGVDSGRIYGDRTSGRKYDRPGLTAPPRRHLRGEEEKGFASRRLFHERYQNITDCSKMIPLTKAAGGLTSARLGAAGNERARLQDHGSRESDRD